MSRPVLAFERGASLPGSLKHGARDRHFDEPSGKPADMDTFTIRGLRIFLLLVFPPLRTRSLQDDPRNHLASTRLSQASHQEPLSLRSAGRTERSASNSKPDEGHMIGGSSESLIAPPSRTGGSRRCGFSALCSFAAHVRSIPPLALGSLKRRDGVRPCGDTRAGGNIWQADRHPASGCRSRQGVRNSGVSDQGATPCRSTSSKRLISEMGSRDSARRVARPAETPSKRRVPAWAESSTRSNAFGETDVVAVIDLPDNATAAGVALLIAASGKIDIKTTVLLTPEEVDAAVKVGGDYRSPGG